MILLDAYPVIGFLRGTPELVDLVEPLVRSGAITSVNAAEVIDHLVRKSGSSPDTAIADVRMLSMAVLPVATRVAYHAARLRGLHYHRTQRSVSLADCVAAAAALTHPAIDALATSDPALLDMVHAEGGSVIALPDSTGRVWSPPTD